MKGKIFYGWYVIGALVFAITISSGTGFYCFGVFMEPIMETFGWSKAQVTWIITTFWIMAALSAPVLGKFTDSFGAKKVMVFACLVNSASLLALGGVRTLWQFCLVYGIKAVAQSGMNLVAIGALVSKWFNKKRGRATGIATTGIGLGGLFLAPFAGYLIPVLGWRGVYIILGLMVLMLVTPVVAWIIRSSPEEMGLFPDGEKQQENRSSAADRSAGKPAADALSGMTLGRALKTSTYWLIAGTNFLASATIFGTLAHQTSYIESIGITRQAASLALGFTAGMGILGKIFFGFLAEKMPIRLTTVICLSVQAVGVVILMMTRNMAMVWVFVVVFGFSMGGMATLRPLIIIEFFGTSAIGTILGSVAVIFSLGAASGPITAAYIYDFFQSYFWAFLIFIAEYAVGTLMISIAPVVQMPKPASAVEGIPARAVSIENIHKQEA